MKKIIACLFALVLSVPFCLQAKYLFDETVHIPLQQEELKQWKIGYQNAKDHGASSTRYIPQNEDINKWSRLLNIQFKDRHLLKNATAVEMMALEASQSQEVSYQIYSQNLNDLVYERKFPTGEQEIVRMVMTKKGLHRVAFVKKTPFEEFERNSWIAKLSSGVIGGKA